MVMMSPIPLSWTSKPGGCPEINPEEINAGTSEVEGMGVAVDTLNPSLLSRAVTVTSAAGCRAAGGTAAPAKRARGSRTAMEQGRIPFTTKDMTLEALITMKMISILMGRRKSVRAWTATISVVSFLMWR